MRRLLAVTALAAMLTGCTMDNEYGACKGFANESEKDPNLKYEVKTMNIVLAVIFSETIFWPVLTGAFWVWCPTGPVKK